MTHIVSFNSFLSTSKLGTIALFFADACLEDKDSCTALIQINININQDSKSDSCIFADINSLSSMGTEEEILFSCGSAFCIDKTVPPTNDPHDPKTRFWTISMAPISNGGSKLQKFVDHERKKLGRMPPLLAFSQLMLDMEQFDDVQVFVQLSLEKLTREHKAQAYNILAQCYLKRGDYIQAKLNLDHALKLSQSNNHPVRSEVLSTHLHYLLAQNHEHMLEIAKEAFCCAIDIEQKGQCLIDLGRIYTRSGQVEKARQYYLEAGLVLLANLPDIHPTITLLQMCESELELQQNNSLIALVHQIGAMNRLQTMPPNHSDFGRLCHQNALICEQNGKYEEAYNFALLAFGAVADNDNLPEQNPFLIECKEHVKKLTLHFNVNPPDSRRLAEMWVPFRK
jgi:tetratricopeptide (TPR) repeat protein